MQSSSAESAFEESSHSSATSPGIGFVDPKLNFREPKNTFNRNQSNAQPRANAATVEVEFFKDLNNYLPTGSLTIPISIGGAKFLSENDWNDSNIIWLAFQGYLNTTEDQTVVAFAKTLADNKWIRVFASKHTAIKRLATLRIYVLPDDVGRRFVERNVPSLRKILMKLIAELDTSFDSWVGLGIPESSNHDNFESSDDDSLFYLFNTLPSPPSAPSSVSCPISNDAIKSAFGSDSMTGLNTRLYPYQARTVATMIRREVEPAKSLDPRFEPLEGPTGQVSHYDKEEGVLLRDSRVYDEARGGILGESMGLGKTLICLAAILATKGNWPDIPPEHSTSLRPIRAKAGSLMQMAATAVGRSKVPWRAFFHDLSRAGEDHDNCRAIMEDNIGSYVIPAPAKRHNRRPSTTARGKTLRLSTATLIVVPQNLVSQWKSEIALHVEKYALKVLCLDAYDKTLMLPADKLLQYDIMLMSKQRFEKEMVPSETSKARSKARRAVKGGCNCSLDDDCLCSTSDEYQSPLKDLHFLRIIMDEGHEFSSSGRKGNVYWALQLLRVDRKWIVSGTPANGLIGVEVGTATYETYDLDETAQKATNQNILEARRKESALAQERKDLEKLGLIVAGYLQLKPWANSKEDDSASWQKYIMPYEDGRRRARSLQSLLESLVVRHRIEDIEVDIHLPPLHNRAVYLQPSYHDKLSINLFLLNLTANALTSERVDEDYMFHRKNRRQLHTLVQNLRQSGFYWTSISPEDVAKTVKVSREYYEGHGLLGAEDQKDDRRLMQNALTIGSLALDSASWKSFAKLHEMGIFVEDFPEEAKTNWSLVPAQGDDPLLVGATQLLKAQNWADTHLYASKPSHGLAEVGATTMQKVRQEAQRRVPEETLEGVHPQDERIVESRSRKKASSASGGVPKLTQKITVSRAKAGTSPRKAQEAQDQNPNPTEMAASKPWRPKSALKSALKAPKTDESWDLIPPDSPLYKSKISGTASAKLSYLLDRVTVLHKDEKILIFYEGDNVAYYISQALDLLGIRYLIYTSTLKTERQNAYINTFNTTEIFRVLVMNVYQAAHGLHIASASRVFFVNPVWQPNVEAQAIKRAHRIGQTRPVYVETLVLKDTLEDQMLQRRKGMTAQEHQKAERSLLDDDTMSTLIKNAKFLTFDNEEVRDASKQVAKLNVPEQLFGRIGKGGGNVDDPDADLIFPTDSQTSKIRARKRKINKLDPDDMGSLPSKRRVGNVSFSDAEQTNTLENSSRKRKSDSEYGPDMSGPPLPIKRRVGFSPLDEAEASSTGSTAEFGSAVEDEPESLFGGDISTAALFTFG